MLFFPPNLPKSYNKSPIFCFTYLYQDGIFTRTFKKVLYSYFCFVMKLPFLYKSVSFSVLFSVFFFLCFFSFSTCFAQNANQLLQEGIALHDARKYDKALKKYEEALKLLPKSPVIYYEMAITYFQKQDYKKAIKYSNKAIKSKSKSTVPAYVIKGSALDMMDKTKKSIKLFESVIADYPNDYLLYYNLALNYYKIEELKKAEQSLMKAIGVNPEHASSHLMLGYVEYDRGRKIPSMMALTYFLFLEPTSQRSERAYEFLKKQLAPNVKKGKDNEFTINIEAAGLDDDFSVIEMTMTLSNAAKSMGLNKQIEDALNEELEKKDSTRTERVVLEDTTPTTEKSIFEANTKVFFSLLDGEGKKDKLWWRFYAPTYNRLAESEHLTTFCYWVSQHSNKNAAKWVAENEEKVLKLKKWIAKN